MAKNVKKLSNEKLISKVTTETIEFIKAVRDGKPQPATPYKDEADRRGMKFSISEKFIHRVMSGEFG